MFNLHEDKFFAEILQKNNFCFHYFNTIVKTLVDSFVLNTIGIIAFAYKK